MILNKLLELFLSNIEKVPAPKLITIYVNTKNIIIQDIKSYNAIILCNQKCKKNNKIIYYNITYRTTNEDYMDFDQWKEFIILTDFKNNDEEIYNKFIDKIEKDYKFYNMVKNIIEKELLI